MVVVNPYLKKKPTAAAASKTKSKYSVNSGKHIHNESRPLASAKAKAPVQVHTPLRVPTATSTAKPKNHGSKFVPAKQSTTSITFHRNLKEQQLKRNYSPQTTKGRPMIKTAVTPSPPHKTHSTINRNGASVASNEMMTKKPRGKAINLKAQLKREIAMLKRQRAQRILAKKQEKERLIREEKRKERERLLAKELQERQQRQELAKKNREKKLQDQKERLMKSLSKDRTGCNAGGGANSDALKANTKISIGVAATNDRLKSVTNVNLNVGVVSAKTLGVASNMSNNLTVQVPTLISSSPTKEPIVSKDCEKIETSNETSPSLVVSAPTPSSNESNQTTMKKCRNDPRNPPIVQKVTGQMSTMVGNQNSVMATVTNQHSVVISPPPTTSHMIVPKGGHNSSTNPNPNPNPNLDHQTTVKNQNRNVAVPTKPLTSANSNGGTAMVDTPLVPTPQSYCGRYHNSMNTQRPIYPQHYGMPHPSPLPQHTQHRLQIYKNVIVPQLPTTSIPNASLMMDPRVRFNYNRAQPYSNFLNQYNPLHQSTAINFMGHSAAPSTYIAMPTKRPRAPRKQNPIEVKDTTLHKDPLVPPSPFCKTHCVVSSPVVIWKKNVSYDSGEKSSFGVQLKFERKGALVEIESSTHLAVDNVHAKSGSKRERQHSSILCDQKVVGDQVQRENGVQQQQHLSPASSNMQVQPLSDDVIRGIIAPTSNIGNTIEIRKEDQHHITSTPSTNVDLQPLPDELIREILSSPSTDVDVDPLPDEMIREIIANEQNHATSAEPSNVIASKEPEVNEPNPTPASSQPLLEAAPTSMIPNPVKKNAKPKRKRISFGVMMVKSATKQNDRAKEGTKQHEMLQSGDIILSINGQSVTGLTFMEATSLFAKSVAKNGNDEVIECTLTIAREKRVIRILDRLEKLSHQSAVEARRSDMKKKNILIPSQKPTVSQGLNEAKLLNTAITPPTVSMTAPVKVPFLVHEHSGKIISGDFSADELKALLDGVRRTGGEYRDSLFAEILTNPVHRQRLIHRNSIDLKRKWIHGVEIFESTINRIAMMNFKKEWETEKSANGSNSNELEESERPLSLSQRSALRFAPRPSRGCKCGRLDHSRVNDEKCVLYRNLRSLARSHGLTISSDNISSKSNDFKGTIEDARKQRMKKLQEEEEADVKEAVFVHQMEVLQVSKLKVAIFAPRHLSVIVLSAIASCREEWGDVIETHGTDRAETVSGNGEYDVDSDSDDEDIPLQSLGKKRTLSRSTLTQGKANKKQRLDHLPNLFCLAKLLHHIGKTWGHLFSELEGSESAWVKHCYQKGYKSFGGFEDDALDVKSLGSKHLPFESLHYSLDSDILGRLKQTRAPTAQNVQDDFLVTYLSSRIRTGLEQEIKSLASIGVISITEEGFPTLPKMWQKNIPPFVLYDMFDQGWSKELDPDNKFCIHPVIRDSLSSEYWTKNDIGWSYVCDNDRISINNTEYESLKKSFIDKHEDRKNEDVGIAQFGI